MPEAIFIQGEHYSRNLRRMCERRFLGACAFYHIWIPDYAHVAEPLYGLLKKRKKFEWEDEHTYAVQKLKKLLLEAPALRKAKYTDGTRIYVTVNTSPWIGNKPRR